MTASGTASETRVDAAVAPAVKTRRSGILLHPTSLPGPHGIGDLGPAARSWIDTLAAARQGWWQVLPLGPTGFGDSPYQCFSAFAGNPYLVSPDALVADGLLDTADLAGAGFPPARVDFGPVIEFKVRLLRRAWERFGHDASASLRDAFAAFRASESAWLDDYALFKAIKEERGGASWLGWDAELRERHPAALAKARNRLRGASDEHAFRQFLFFRQWHALREHAVARGVRILGDVPIFVSSDSADVWAHPEFFRLDAEHRPAVVAGVPPDYFSATGQLWGNPLYDWDTLRADGFRWWIARLRATLELVDRVRVDHFRGFEAYWEVEAGMPTAAVGRWVPGPGAVLFEALRAAFGALPILAEDLGVITPEVDALREQFGLPGMRVLQFAFGSGPSDRFLPHHYDRHTAVYTGTHDNDTTCGWYATLPEPEKTFLHRYLGYGTSDAPPAGDIVWELIRQAWGSVADLAIVPLQDLLELGSEARMNTPAQAGGNWGWRVTASQLADPRFERLANLTQLYDRA
jgi:4-alpha-glucanotransferase